MGVEDWLSTNEIIRNRILRITQKEIINNNIEINLYIKEFIQYLLLKKRYALNDKWLSLFKFIFHNEMVKSKYLLYYFISSLIDLYKLL